MFFLIAIIQFFLATNIIIVTHELGHLLFTKLFKIRVESFGIGILYKIFKFKKNNTEYYFGAIPIGGSIVISKKNDENDLSKINQNINLKEKFFEERPSYQKIMVMSGGILMNVILSFFIFFFINIFEKKREINKTKDVFTEKKSENMIISSIKKSGQTINLILYENYLGIKNLFLEKKYSKIISSPISMTKLFYKKFSLKYFFKIVAILSLIVAFTNAIPLPALDGGHILLILIEIITKKRINSTFLLIWQKIGVSFFIILSITVFISDFIKLFKNFNFFHC